MDTNNIRSTPPSGEPTMDIGDWRTQLQPDSRQIIINKIMDTLKRHPPFRGDEALNELRKIVVRFEEKIFMQASSESDYLWRISLEMPTMEAKSQDTIPNTGNNSKPTEPGSQGMQNQVHSQGQSFPIPLQSNQSQACEQPLPQGVPKKMASAGVQSSAGLQSGMPSVSGLSLNPIPNVVGQNSNTQNMFGISQSPLGQGMPSNIFASQQKQVQVRQQVVLQQQEQRQEQQLIYILQLQQQLRKQKIQQGDLQPPLMLSHMQQEQQQNLLPPTQLQSSQQPASLDSTAQTGHANGGDWQEEVYQKIKAMKETYLPELNEMHQKIAAKLLRHDSLPQQPKSEQLEKLKLFKAMLERIISFLSVSKASIAPTFKDKLGSYEKQIINFINTNRPRKPVSALQQGQLSLTHMHSMQQSQPQINQTQSPISSPQLLQALSPQMPQHSSPKFDQQSLLTSISKTGTPLQSAKSTFVFPSPSTPLAPMPGESEKPFPDSSLSNAANVGHQQVTGVQAGSQSRAIGTPGIPASPLLAVFTGADGTGANNALTTDYGKPNIAEPPHDPRVNVLMDTNNWRPTPPSGEPTMDTGDWRTQLQPDSRQRIVNKIMDTLKRHLPFSGQESLNELRKIAVRFEEKIFTAASSQSGYLRRISLKMLTMESKSQNAIPPSTGNNSKPHDPVPGTSLSNAANVGPQQVTGVQAGSQSCAIGTPGIPASPLLAVFTGADGTRANNALTTDYGKPNIAEQPHDPRVNVAKPISLKSLSETVVTVVDEAATAVGEDLAAMRKRGMHARNFFTQTGMTGAEKMRCYVSALVVLALMFWFIFIHKSPILKH